MLFFLANCFTIKQVFFKAGCVACQAAVSAQHKRCAIKHHLVLGTDVVCVHQRQTGLECALAHARYTLAALAHMKRRCVDDCQQLGSSLFGQLAGLVKPSVFADQQADRDAAHLEHAHPLAGRKVAALVKHLVVGQLAFGIGF